MKNCSVIRDLLPQFTDGALSPESAAMVRRHLQSCPDCRAAARSYSKRVHLNRSNTHRAKFRYSAIAARVRHEKWLRRVTLGSFCLALGYLLGHLFPLGDDK